MVRVYEDLTEQEQDRLADAWLTVSGALRIYEDVTGAGNLQNIIYDDLWETITFQRDERSYGIEDEKEEA